MLKFPLPPIPDPHLPLDKLSFDTYQQLCAVLDDEKCKKVLSCALAKLNPGSTISQRPCSCAELITLFSRWRCTAQVMAFLLESCGFSEALYLFKNQEPLRVLQQPPTEIIADLHENFTLTIEVEGFPEPSFQWFKDNLPLPGQTSKSLIIPNFGTAHVGSYNCELMQRCRDGSSFTVETNPTKVKMESFSPYFVREPPGKIQVEYGGVFFIDCNIEGYPVPEIQWFKDSELLQGQSDPVLKVESATLPNAGWYTCLATNTEGQARSRETLVIVDVHEPLKITLQPKFPNDYAVEAGARLHLACRATGAESYLWYCNGVPLPDQQSTDLIVEALPELFNGETRLAFQCRIWNKSESLLSDIATTVINTGVSQKQHAASAKLALLIGNWTYDFHGLKKVRSDVKTLHDILYRMEFDVLSLCNLRKMEMLNAVDRFCELILPNSYVVVYFAGHGILYHNDYFMPVDLPVDSDYSQSDLIGRNDIIAKIQEKSPKLLAVFLDMCRSIPKVERNPRIRAELPREVPLDSRSNLVMAWATSENRYAYEIANESNGIFMTFLKREMERPNVLVTEMLERLKQNFKQEIPKLACDQIPTTFSSLAEALSLHDPVDRASIGTSMWNNSQLLFNSWRQLPPKQVATFVVHGVPVFIHVVFSMMDDCFFNGLKIELLLEGSQRLTFQPSIDPPYLELLETRHEWDLQKCTITIHNLQALLEDASLFLQVVECPGEIVQIHLGQPLISKAHLCCEAH